MRVIFFPADFPVARVSRFTVSPEKLEKIAGQLASHAGVFRGAQIRAPQKTPAWEATGQQASFFSHSKSYGDTAISVKVVHATILKGNMSI